MSKLQTIGERETRAAAELAAEADPTTAFRWTCPLACGVQSQLYTSKDRATEAFVEHLGTHTVQDAIPLLQQTAWLATFALAENIAPNDGAKRN